MIRADENRHAPAAKERPEQPLGILFYLMLAAVVLMWWIVGAALWQEGWAGCLTALPWFLALAVLVSLLVGAQESTRSGPLVFLGMLVLPATGLWLYAAGTLAALRGRDWATLLWDLGALAVALALTDRLAWWLGRRRDRRGRFLRERFGVQWDALQGLVWLVLAWVLLSVVTVYRTPALPVDPQRFARLEAAAATVDVQAERWDDLRVGLALSGGGYRAAVFHAGVLQALEELSLRVDNLSTVSGGSIIGAYYAVGGDPAVFVDAVAAGRFDLKRQLLSVHNALRLPFPARLPGSQVELLPLCHFDRLDVQRRLLERTLFHRSTLAGDIGGDQPRRARPHLMIAVTDLTYGFQIGLLPDGFVKLGDASRDVYRGRTFESDRELRLAERVAISGAFPVALPPRPWRVRVEPVRATGRGWRDLLLVDGGARDNLGLELLRAADGLAATGDTHGIEDSLMPPHWDLDVLLVSDGGAAFGVLEDAGSSLAQLARTFEVSAVPFRYPTLSPDPCARLVEVPPRFSPAIQLLPPDTQFHLKQGAGPSAPVARPYHLRFDPALYPQPVSRRLIALLPNAADRSAATGHLSAFRKGWGTHQTRGPRWSFIRTRSAEVCARREQDPRVPEPLPGVCAALALEAVLLKSVHADLEVFRDTPTLDDRLPLATTTTLERLGKTLVFLRWPQVERQLQTARTCSQREETRAGG